MKYYFLKFPPDISWGKHEFEEYGTPNIQFRKNINERNKYYKLSKCHENERNKSVSIKITTKGKDPIVGQINETKLNNENIPKNY